MEGKMTCISFLKRQMLGFVQNHCLTINCDIQFIYFRWIEINWCKCKIMILKSLSYHPNMHCTWFAYFNIQQLQDITEHSWLFILVMWGINNIAFNAHIFFSATTSKTWISVIVNIFKGCFSAVKELTYLSEISWHSYCMVMKAS